MNKKGINKRLKGLLGNALREWRKHLTKDLLIKEASEIPSFDISRAAQGMPFETEGGAPASGPMPQGQPKDVEKEDSKYLKKESKKKLGEVSAPGQETWIKKNKARFTKEYGKKKGMSILYGKAWNKSKGR